MSDILDLNLFDELVDRAPEVTLDSLDTISVLDDEEQAIDPKLLEVVQLEEGDIDPRLKLLSHSSRTTLHSCPRKYQLYRLQSKELSLEEVKGKEQGVTFAYGTAVGVGIQSTLEGKSEEQILLDTFLAWDTDLLAETKRHNKSFWLTVFAIQKFIASREAGYLAEYDLVYYEGKPAVELSFQITLPGGFKYRGFVDAVLKHKLTGHIMVLECKTTSGTAQPASYKNSGQALGYSVVLDKLFPEASSYTVLYLVYESKSYEYKELPFEKSLLQRALWLQELLLDTKSIQMYSDYEIFPMHGESCFNFFRECEYLGICTLNTGNLSQSLTKEVVQKIAKDEDNYMFKLDFAELVKSQLEKGEN